MKGEIYAKLVGEHSKITKSIENESLRPLRAILLVNKPARCWLVKENECDKSDK